MKPTATMGLAGAAASNASEPWSNALLRAPRKPWFTTWALTLLLFGSGVAGVEAFWRSQWHQPSVVESDWGLWAVQRSRLRADDRRSVALLGLSRMLYDFSIPTFKSRFPNHRVAQLAVNGQSPIAALRDLAEDERFMGVVLCDLTETEFASDHWLDQQPNVDHYRSTSVVEYPETLLKAFWQSHFALLNPNLSLKSVLVRLLRREGLPEADTRAAITRIDRSRALDSLRLPSVAALQAQQAAGHAERLVDRMAEYGAGDWFPGWRSDVEAIAPYVVRIQRRGGRVIFVRLPTQGTYWANEEKYTPRSVYWDQVARLTSASTIHFKDLDGLPEFNLPDLSHLDYRDTPRFTDRLLDELVRLGALPE